MRNVIVSLTIIALALGLLFTACQKNVEQETVVATNSDLNALLASKLGSEQFSPILLPQGLASHQESIYQFIDGLSETDLRTRMETYRIYNIIKQTGNLPKLYEAQPSFEALTEADLQKYAPEALKNQAAFERKSSDLGLGGAVSSIDGLVGVPGVPGGCLGCGCDVIEDFCIGTTLYIVLECCNPICNTEVLKFPNSTFCGGGTDPCDHIVCGEGESCQNGECVLEDLCDGLICPLGEHCEDGECVVDNPCAGVVCLIGEHCEGGECVPNLFCNDGICAEGYYCLDGICLIDNGCGGVTCSPNQVCINGDCIYVCRPPCSIGEACVDGICVGLE